MMKTRITAIVILAVAAITFAQPRMDRNDVGARAGGRFQRPQPGCCCMQCPMQGFQRQSPSQGFNSRRPAMAQQRMRGMMQQNRGFGQDFQRRGQMPCPQAPYDFKGKDGFMPQGGQMEGRRFAYPGAQQFKMDGRGGDFNRQKDSKKFEGKKGVCPMNKIDAPKPQRAPKEAMEAPRTRKAPADAPDTKDMQVKPEVTELRLKLRSAMIERDYKSAERVLKRLAEVDK